MPIDAPQSQRRISRLGLVITILGLLIVLATLTAPYIGLGRGETFVGYRAFGWTRTEIGHVGEIAVLCGALIMFPTLLWHPRWLRIARNFWNTLKPMHGFLGKAVVTALCVIAIVGGLKLFDVSLTPNVENLPGHDLEQSARNARTLELFPFSGWHMQTNTSNGDFRLGPMGFAVDFDLQNPPPKAPNEYRIILIGGSGAQGWGASSTEKTMARVLEGMLNERKDGRHYRVINLAMGSSITYQNFISLNRWAHPLHPDLILSYSGINDYVVPIYHEENLDTFYQFNRLNALAIAARGSEFPPQLHWLRDFLPNLMMKTTIGYGIKVALYQNYFEEQAKNSYRTSRGLDKMSANDFLDKVVTPLYIHALQSIKRDFDGIPIVLVLQASNPEEHAIHLTTGLSPDFYERMYRQVGSALSGPGWHLANFHAYNMRAPNPAISVHPNDAGQVILANFIYTELTKSFLKADLQ